MSGMYWGHPWYPRILSSYEGIKGYRSEGDILGIGLRGTYMVSQDTKYLGIKG